jgi:large conductance mechanosensitive channel
MKDFKEFLLRGNLVTTAVAFVIGVAFAAVVTALVTDLITPLISAIFGSSDFSTLHFTINGSIFFYGSFLNAVITFVTIAFVIFFFVVKPVNHLMDRMKTEPPVDETVKECEHCLSSIPVAASVCSFCTRDVAAA